MENYIALLILIVPGYIARETYQMLHQNQPGSKNSLENTLALLLYSAFVCTVSYAFLWKIGVVQYLNFNEIKTLFSNAWFISIYIPLIILASILIAVVWFILQPLHMKIINFIRVKTGKIITHTKENVWEVVFNDGESHLVEIYKGDTVIAKGLIELMNSDHKELYIMNQNLVSEKEQIGCFKNLKGTYCDYKNGIVIKEYYIGQQPIQ